MPSLNGELVKVRGLLVLLLECCLFGGAGFGPSRMDGAPVSARWVLPLRLLTTGMDEEG